MVEGTANLQSCAGCEGDCYCTAWIDYQNAITAVLDYLKGYEDETGGDEDALMEWDLGALDLARTLRQKIAEAVGIEGASAP